MSGEPEPRFPRDLTADDEPTTTFTLNEPRTPRGSELPWRLIAELIGDGEAIVKIAGPRKTHSGLLVRYADLVRFAREVVDEDDLRRSKEVKGYGGA